MRVFYQQHMFHLVDYSPWPFFAALASGVTMISATLYMHFFIGGGWFFFFGVIFGLFVGYLWWSDVIVESTFDGFHTSVVQQGLRMGMLLFILSEVMFFVSFFWAFFHSSLAPTIEIGSVWPPVGIVTFNPKEIPLLNTFILVLSGVTITACHHYILIGKSKSQGANQRRISKIELTFLLTIILAFFFTELQGFEYQESAFSIYDGIYGSTFFMATGFHGLHVYIGLTFIVVCFIRFLFSHFSSRHHVGFEAAAWYWHFVDVVWLFLFVSIYWWGSL